MFCDLSSLRRRVTQSLAIGALLASALLLTPGCGHKKSPIPPPSKVPQKVILKAHQRGHEAIVSFPFPTTTISGTLLPGISKIELWRYSLEVPEFAIELLAEEARQRDEAQELLDELGLPLYETPLSTDPAADPLDVLPASDTLDGKRALPIDSASATQDTPPELPSAASTPEEALDTAPADDPVEADEGDGGDGEGDDGDEEGGDDAEGDGEGEETELSEEEQLALRVEAARSLLISPPTPKSSFLAATVKDFHKGSELVLSVEGDDVPRALIGDDIVLRLALPSRPVEGPEIGYLFAAKVFALNGKPSDFSNMQAILPSDTPPAPQEVAVEAQADGVYISWSADEDPAAGFRVYRRDAQTRLYGDPLSILTFGTERYFLDRQAVFGARYIYGLTAVETTTPLLEGDLSSEHEIDYRDRFGPGTPAGLVAFPETGRVRLLWTAVADIDVAGYEVSRRAIADAEPTPLTIELVTRGQYLDETVASGDVWFYSVVAVDTSGNRSQASVETEVRVP